MRQTALLVALCLACAVVGALAARLVGPGGTDPAPTDPDGSFVAAVRQLARTVEGLEERLDKLQRAPSLVGTPPRPAPPEESDAPATVPQEPPTPHDGGEVDSSSPPGADILVRREASDPPLPPTNQDHVDELRSWAEDESVRARWLLASEAAVLGWFGAPGAIYADGSAERWQYHRAVSGRTRIVTIYLHRGRVIRMHP